MNLSNLFDKFELISAPSSLNALNENRHRVRVCVKPGGPWILSPWWEALPGQNPYEPPGVVEMLRTWYDAEVAPRLPKPLNDVLRADYSKPLPAPRPFLMLGKPKVYDMRELDKPAQDPPQPAKLKPVAPAPKEPRSRKFDFSI